MLDFSLSPLVKSPAVALDAVFCLIALDTAFLINARNSVRVSAAEYVSTCLIFFILFGVHLESVWVCPQLADEHNALVYAPQLDVFVITPAQSVVNNGGRCQHPLSFGCEPLLERDHAWSA